MSGLLDILGSTALYAAAIRLAVPVFLASLGETFAERAGLVNVGLEGMMLSGACGSVIASWGAHSAVVGVLGGAAAGLSVAALQAWLAIRLGIDQIVSGIALNIGCLGLTSFLARTVWTAGAVPQVSHFDTLNVPVLHSVPIIGPILFSQNLMVYGTIAAAIAGWWMLVRTRWGLEVRGCGEDPRASDSLGLPVSRRRWETMLICGVLAGVGGAVIALTEMYTFTDDMTGGQGFIALAVVIIARWSPSRVVLAALLFGICDALALRVQASGSSIPYELMLTLPYVAALLVYAGVVGRAVAPAALGRPYLRR